MTFSARVRFDLRALRQSAFGVGAILVAMSCGSSESDSGGGQPDGSSEGASGTAGSGGSSGNDGSTGARCGAAVCGAGSFCCGPAACGFCAPNGAGPFCGFTCEDAGVGGTGGGGGSSGAGGSGGTAGFAGACTELSCAGAASCRCCPAGGPAQYCTCSTACSSNADCRDPARPTCDVDQGRGEGFCRDDSFICCWGCL
jgi:hypothetical protein